MCVCLAAWWNKWKNRRQQRGCTKWRAQPAHLNKIDDKLEQAGEWERVALLLRWKRRRKKSNENILIQLAHSHLIQFNQRFDTINVFLSPKDLTKRNIFHCLPATNAHTFISLMAFYVTVCAPFVISKYWKRPSIDDCCWCSWCCFAHWLTSVWHWCHFNGFLYVYAYAVYL